MFLLFNLILFSLTRDSLSYRYNSITKTAGLRDAEFLVMDSINAEQARVSSHEAIIVESLRARRQYTCKVYVIRFLSSGHAGNFHLRLA